MIYKALLFPSCNRMRGGRELFFLNLYYDKKKTTQFD